MTQLSLLINKHEKALKVKIKGHTKNRLLSKKASSQKAYMYQSIKCPNQGKIASLHANKARAARHQNFAILPLKGHLKSLLRCLNNSNNNKSTAHALSSVQQNWQTTKYVAPPVRREPPGCRSLLTATLHKIATDHAFVFLLVVRCDVSRVNYFHEHAITGIKRNFEAEKKSTICAIPIYGCVSRLNRETPLFVAIWRWATSRLLKASNTHLQLLLSNCCWRRERSKSECCWSLVMKNQKSIQSFRGGKQIP